MFDVYLLIPILPAATYYYFIRRNGKLNNSSTISPFKSNSDCFRRLSVEFWIYQMVVVVRMMVFLLVLLLAATATAAVAVAMVEAIQQCRYSYAHAFRLHYDANIYIETNDTLTIQGNEENESLIGPKDYNLINNLLRPELLGNIGVIWQFNLFHYKQHKLSRYYSILGLFLITYLY